MLHPLELAARDGNISNVQDILYHTNPELSQSLKDNALMEACENNHPDIVKLMIAHGADKNDWYSMYAAVCRNSLEAVKALLEEGYDLSGENNSTLYDFAKMVSPEMVLLLTSHGSKEVTVC